MALIVRPCSVSYSTDYRGVESRHCITHREEIGVSAHQCRLGALESQIVHDVNTHLRTLIDRVNELEKLLTAPVRNFAENLTKLHDGDLS